MKKTLVLAVIYFAALYPSTLSAERFIAHCRNYPPELSFDGSKCVGVIPDLVTDIFNELGHELIWNKVPWLRSMREAKQGKVDLLIRHSMTKERNVFLKPIPYAHYIRNLSFYKSPTYKPEIKSYEDLKKVNIGAIRGNFYSSKFSMLDSKVLTLVEKTEQLIGMLELGRIDVVVTSRAHNVELFEDRFDKAIFEEFFSNPLYISIPKRSKAAKLYEDVATIVMNYRRSGKINQYFEKYGLPVPDQNFE